MPSPFRPADVAWIFLIATVVMLPGLLWGPSRSHSGTLNYVWAVQFAELLGQGEVYPRWLPRSFEGLGSPTFYFYPPLAFYVPALLDLAGLSTLQALNVAALVMTFASGLAMYVWLRTIGGQALLGASLYMVTPYHLHDHYVRGAMAEHGAFIWLPLVALGIGALPSRRGIATLALAYGALILTHLPVALLATGFLILPLAVARVAGDRATLGPGLLGGGLGLGLAAAYLVPALTLQDHISIEVLWTPHHQVRTWLTWADPSQTGVLAWLAVMALVAVGVAAGAAARTRAARLWALLAAVAAAAAFGLVPFVWDIPAMAKVQFPWRLLCIVDFAAVTAFALAWPERRFRAVAAVAYLVALSPVLSQSGRALGQAAAAPDYAEAIEVHMPDALEYLPRGYLKGLSRSDELTDPGAFGDLPLATTIHVTEPQTVTLRQAAFPIWRVVDGAGREVPTRGPLLSFDAEPGDYRVERVATLQERVGLSISALAALALAAVMAGVRPTRAYASVRLGGPSRPLPPNGS